MAKKISGWVKKSENKFLYTITWLIRVISILIIKNFYHPGISNQGKLQPPETFTIGHTLLEGH
jgi:hypothetical protein